jgi:hypothetical protein
MMNPFKRFFQEEITSKDKIPFSAEELAGPVSANRESLQLIGNWIDDKAFAASFFNYGVPDFIREVINKPIGDALTYTDLMLLIARKYFQQVNYLEIGVSVGKNFFQLLRSLPDAALTGFDIEEINPVLERQLAFAEKKEWPTPRGSIKKNGSSFKTYSFGDKKVTYLSADVWDEASWERLKGQKFNIVFSDALHSPKAILFEFKMLEKYGLLDDRFVIVWDDLVGKMRDSFYKIIRRYNEAYHIRDIYLVEVNGWVGQHEGAHAVGIISNFEF